MPILSDKITPQRLFFKIAIAFITIVLIAFMFPKGESIESEVSEGSIWLKDDLIAPFSFPIIKSRDIYKRELTAAEKSVYPVFIEKKEVEGNALDSLKNYSTYLLEIMDYNINNDSTETVNPTFLSTVAFTKFKCLRLEERNIIEIRGPRLRDLFAATRFALTRVYKKGILSLESGEERNDSIAIRVGNIDRIEAISKFLFFNKASEEIVNDIGRLNYPKDLESALIEYSVHFVLPNLAFSSELTEEEVDQAKNNVSKYSGIVNEN